MPTANAAPGPSEVVDLDIYLEELFIPFQISNFYDSKSEEVAALASPDKKRKYSLKKGVDKKPVLLDLKITKLVITASCPFGSSSTGSPQK